MGGAAKDAGRTRAAQVKTEVEDREELFVAPEIQTNLGTLRLLFTESLGICPTRLHDDSGQEVFMRWLPSNKTQVSLQELDWIVNANAWKD